MKSHIDADYLDAERYDQFYGEYAEPDDWLVELLLQRSSVLELACGTGRIAIPLAQRGLSVTGIDYCEPMLDLAQNKVREAQVQVELAQCDFRAFDLGKKFGSILLLFNALWHVHERHDFAALMQCVRRHLQPDGLFVLDVFVPALEFLHRDPQQRYPFSSYTDPETGAQVQVTETYSYEPDTQISRLVHYKGTTDEIVGGLNLRMYFPQELDALLECNGMAIDQKFGSWDRTPFDASSNHQLYLCTSYE